MNRVFFELTEKSLFLSFCRIFFIFHRPNIFRPVSILGVPDGSYVRLKMVVSCLYCTSGKSHSLKSPTCSTISKTVYIQYMTRFSCVLIFNRNRYPPASKGRLMNIDYIHERELVSEHHGESNMHEC